MSHPPQVVLDSNVVLSALVFRSGVAGRLRHMRSSLGERQKGGLLARVASNLPVVGAAGGFLAERGGRKRAADEARREFGRPV